MIPIPIDTYRHLSVPIVTHQHTGHVKKAALCAAAQDCHEKDRKNRIYEFSLYCVFRNRIHIPGLTLLVLFKLRSPSRELDKLFIGPMIVSRTLIQLCDLRHFFIGKRKVQNIQVIPDMIDVFASGNHGKAHPGMPAENDLRGGLSLLSAEFRKDRLIDQ